MKNTTANEMKKIKVFDTTLRDGEQSPGCSMNLDEKIKLAKQLEKMGVDVIEAGFAIASKGDFEAVSAIAKTVENATVASLARTLTKDIDAAWEAVKHAKHPRIHTFIATSDIHMKHKLKMSEDEVVARAVDMVKYAKEKCNDIEFSAEDATRSDIDFLIKIFTAVINAGATVINVPDTVGYTVPEEYFEFISKVKAGVTNIEGVDISVHCHNDLGMAVANSIMAIKAGATQVECTVNGIGERAGNAALEEIVMALNTRRDILGVETNIITTEIMKTSKMVSSITGVSVQPNKAIVGKNAFAHESGIHQHGMLQEKTTYEIMTPESVGLVETTMVLGKHSGKHAFKSRIDELGYDHNEIDIDSAFVAFKALADKKKVVYDSDIEALILSKSLDVPDTYNLGKFVIQSGNDITSTATISIVNEENTREDASTGDGPVDAAFKAIDKIVKKDFTGDQFFLSDYKIRAISEGKDAQGEANIKISKDGKTYRGKGISTDVVEASIKGYIHALNKMAHYIGEGEVI